MGDVLGFHGRGGFAATRRTPLRVGVDDSDILSLQPGGSIAIVQSRVLLQMLEEDEFRIATKIEEIDRSTQ